MATDAQGDNPYQSPETQGAIAPRPRSKKSVSGWWVTVVLLNLPLPVMFGIAATEGFGRIGMLFGVVIVTYVGLFFCRQVPRLMRDLSNGAMLTALSQLYPVLQLLVGTVAMQICTGDGPGSGSSMVGVIQITTATLLTGIGLILPALVVGVTIGMLGRFIADR